MRLRPRLSPVMDRFLAGQFFGPFMVCVAAFTAAYLLGDMFDRFNDLIKYGGLGLLGLEYFALKIPLILTQILPVACLAGVLLGFAILNRSGEVLACQQLGISRLEMAIPVMFVATAYAFLKSVKGGKGENAIGVTHIDSHGYVILAIGFVVSFIVAYAAVAWFLRWVRTRGFAPFAVYRIALGVLVLAWMAHLIG